MNAEQMAEEFKRRILVDLATYKQSLFVSQKYHNEN